MLRKAIRTHVDTAKAAGRGEGFDRHLFGLMMAAFETGKVDLVAPLNEIAGRIIKIVKGTSGV